METDSQPLNPRAQAWIDELIEEMTDEEVARSQVAAINATINVEVPEIGVDPDLRQILAASTASGYDLYLHLLAGGDLDKLDPSEAMINLAHALARRGLEVSAVLSVYRVGQRQIWQVLMDRVLAAPLDQASRASVMAHLWNHSSRAIERAVDRVAAAAYGADAERRLSDTLARRAELVELLLAGEPVDSMEARRTLGHHLSAQQVGLVLWCPVEIEEVRDPIAMLERSARDLAEAAGAPQPLTIPSGTRMLWGWLTPQPEALLDTETLAWSPPDGVLVSIGRAGPGPEGFRNSHDEALRAHRVAARASVPQPITWFADVEIESALGADWTALKQLVQRELGDLGDTGPAAARLRETVRIYLNCDSSVTAAGVLHLHKNTVLYRIQQAEGLLGRPVRERRLPLEVALRAVATYGEVLLDRAADGDGEPYPSTLR